MWRVRLFGGPVLEDAHGNRVRRFRSQRVAALLAYLCLHLGRPCGREEIAAALWPEEAEPQVLSNRLRFTLASLRRQLEPPGIPFGSVLDVESPGQVRLRAETVWCDAAAVERALKSGARAEAASLMNGVLLPGFYDEWILEVRTRFELLGDDLGAEPALRIRKSVAAVAAPAPQRPAGRLPLYLTRFFGRESERQRLQEWIAEYRLVTITGPGGIGKTRMAVEVVRETGIPCAFVALADVTDPGDLAAVSLRALLITPQAGVDPVAQLIAVLERHPSFLLILDNAEHLVPAAAAFALRLLEAIPALHILTTSRQRLNVPGEAVLPLDPLETPRYESSPERLLEFPAVHLFVDRALRARPDFHLSTRQIGSLVEICARLDGMPLALELAAARVTTQSTAQIAEALKGSLMDLASHQHGIPPRHRSLRAVLQGSFELLTPAQQSFFAGLSVFRAGWTLEAARRTTDCDQAEETMRILVERSLVVAREDEATTDIRFGLLDTLREFAAERLADDARAHCARRHAMYFLGIAERCGPLLHKPGGDLLLAELDRENENLRAAMQWSLDTADLDVLCRFTRALLAFWATRGHYAEGRRWNEALLTAAADGPARIRVEALLVCGRFAIRRNDFGTAWDYVEQALALCRDEGDVYGVLRCTMALGDISRLNSQLETAVEHYHTCLQLCLTCGSDDDLAKCHHGLGVTRFYQGDYGTAREHLGVALRIRERLSYPLEVARTQNLLAFALREEGDSSAAERLFRAALQVFSDHGDRWYRASTQGGLGTIAFERGDLEAARHYWEDALATMRDIGAQDNIADLLVLLSYLRLRTGDLSRARDTLRESLELANRVRNRQSIASVLLATACLLHAERQPAPAARLLAAASDLFEQISVRLIHLVHARVEVVREDLREILGEAEFEAAAEAGKALTPDEAIVLAQSHLAN